MEYCEGGDMLTLIKKCRKDSDFIAEDVIWKIFTQILLALNECHNRKSGKILHRDLKPANIFLDAENNVKLGDFGLSKMMNDQSVFAYTHVGTPYYMSPEQINEKEYNEKSDIWSAGCLLYEIAALRPPFEAKNHLSLAMKIREGKFDRLPRRYSEELQKLIEIMLSANPDRRPSAEALLKFPLLDMRVKEKKLRDKLAQVKQIEEDIRKKEEDLKKLENNLKQREETLNQIEIKLTESEKKLEQSNKQNPPTPPKLDENTNLNRYYIAPVSRVSNRSGSSRERCNNTTILAMDRRSSSKEFRNLPSEQHSFTVGRRSNSREVRRLPDYQANRASSHKVMNTSLKYESFELYKKKVF